MLQKAQQASNIEQLMGYEGQAAKTYFNMLGKLIDPAFTFNGRSKRPPMDPFNSLISLGYSILLNEIYGKLEARGLNAYFAFLHADREKHPGACQRFDGGMEGCAGRLNSDEPD